MSIFLFRYVDGSCLHIFDIFSPFSFGSLGHWPPHTNIHFINSSKLYIFSGNKNKKDLFKIKGRKATSPSCHSSKLLNRLWPNDDQKIIKTTCGARQIIINPIS